MRIWVASSGSSTSSSFYLISTLNIILTGPWFKSLFPLSIFSIYAGTKFKSETSFTAQYEVS